MRISFNTFRPYNTNCNSNNSVNQQKRSQAPTFTNNGVNVEVGDTGEDNTMNPDAIIYLDILDKQGYNSYHGDTKKCLEAIKQMVFGDKKIPEPRDYYTETELEHFHDQWNRACEEDSD